MKGTNPGSRNIAEVPSLTAEVLESAFAQLHSELLGTLFYMVGNREDAHDALQDTFLKCWRHRDKVAEIKQLRAWIFRIAINTARDLRQTAWRRKRSALENEQTIVDDSHRPPESILGHREDRQQLIVAIQQLRVEEREVFLLRQNGDMTYQEIGEALGVPTATVKTRMRLAIANLRNVVVKSVNPPWE